MFSSSRDPGAGPGAPLAAARVAGLTAVRAAGLTAGLIACLIAGLVAGCSGSPSSPAPSSAAPSGSPSGSGAADPAAASTGTAPEQSSTTAPGPTASGSPTGPAPSSTAEVSGPAAAASATGSGAPAGPGAAVVQAIRVGDHGSFDRVVIEFAGTFGAWDVGYVPKVVSDPEGKDVALAGAAFVAVRVQRATFDNAFQVGGGVAHVRYSGARRISAGLVNVKEIAEAGDFEAVLGLGIGVAQRAGLRAYRLTGPSRLVIDISH